MKAKKQPSPFGIRDKLGYLLGDLGNDFTFILSSSFLLKFYTDVIKVSAGVVGLVMMLARFVDAVTDVSMGRICDRARPGAQGKFKPWIIRMAVPVAFSSFLIYQSSIAAAPMWLRILWLSVSYILWGSVFYTSINIPYGSMASTISREPSERQSLSTFRTMGSTLAGAVIGVGIPLLAYDKRIVSGVQVAEMNGQRFTMIAGLFSLLAIISYILCYFMTTERIIPESVEEKRRISLKEMLKSSLTNPALISIIVASVLMLLSQFTLQQMSNYVFPDYYASTEAQSVSTLTMLLSMAVAAVSARPLAEKFGKAEISAVSCLLASAVCLTLFFVRPRSVWAYVGLNLFSWLGLGLFAMVSWALITDVIDSAEIKNGVREDGSIYALYSFSRKLGQAAAAGLSGLLLTLIGYGKTEGGLLPQSVKDGIFNISTLLPAVGFLLLAAVLWFWYPLHKQQVIKNTEILRQKHGE